MDFYDDIEVDFGEKDELGVGDVIALLDGSSLGPKSKSKSKKKTKEIVFEDDVGSDEYERYNPPPIPDSSYSGDPDFVDSIAREVSEVTGNELLNEQLENHYRQQFPPPKPKKTSSKKKNVVPKIGQNITKKSDLRKEMAFTTMDDSKVTFKKNRTNAALGSVALTEKNIPDGRGNDSEEAKSQFPENDVEEKKNSSMDNVSYKMDRVRQWVNNIEDSFEDEYYSANDTTTDTSYFTASASASETETPKRRATSKRSKPQITDACVGFKVTPKPAPKSIPKPASSKSSMLKKKNNVYIPGPDTSRFNFKMSDFPAIR